MVHKFEFVSQTSHSVTPLSYYAFYIFHILHTYAKNPELSYIPHLKQKHIKKPFLTPDVCFGCKGKKVIGQPSKYDILLNQASFLLSKNLISDFIEVELIYFLQYRSIFFSVLIHKEFAVSNHIKKCLNLF